MTELIFLFCSKKPKKKYFQKVIVASLTQPQQDTNFDRKKKEKHYNEHEAKTSFSYHVIILFR